MLRILDKQEKEEAKLQRIIDKYLHGNEKKDVCLTCAPEDIPIPTKEGYEFVSWYYDEDLSIFAQVSTYQSVKPEILTYDDESCPVYQEVTLYAAWKKIENNQASDPLKDESSDNKKDDNPKTGAIIPIFGIGFMATVIIVIRKANKNRKMFKI